MEVIFNSFILILISEMGDKTMILAMVLATRFKKPWTIMAGILVATLLNHGLAAFLGKELADLIPQQYLVWILAATFFAFGIWMLRPDKEEEFKEVGHFGAFLTTTIVFFLAEMGDKTQLATFALGATYDSPLLVTIGTTLGMLGADGVAVFAGEHLTRKISMLWIHRIAAALFILFGIGILIGF